MGVRVTCHDCRRVRVWGESGHRGDFMLTVELCPKHADVDRLQQIVLDQQARLKAFETRVDRLQEQLRESGEKNARLNKLNGQLAGQLKHQGEALRLLKGESS